MLQEGFAKSHFVGRDGFIWWIGQVVNEDQWVVNIPGLRTPTTNEHLGFDYRYKVRIMGYHTADIEALPDEDLPWASVMLPVTSGTGNGGAYQTPSIRQGDFCYGFFLDGENAQHPVIMGLIGYNQYVSISQLPKAAFQPFSGYTNRDIIPRYVLNVVQEEGKAKQDNPITQESTSSAPDSNGTNSSSPEVNPRINNSIIERRDGASKENYEDLSVIEPIESFCEKVPMGKIVTNLQKAIQNIQKYKKTLSSWESAVSKKVGDIRNDLSSTNVANFIDNLIQFEIDGATLSISEAIKWVIQEIQRFATKKINDAAKPAFYLLFPNQRPPLKEGIEKASEGVVCLFRKLISNLFKIIGNFLKDALNKFVNVPLCAAENLLGGLIGEITGFINSALDNILSPISNLLGSAFDLAGDILDFIEDLLSLLLCDEQPECAEITEWSIWGGPEPTFTFDVNRIVNGAKSVASNAGAVFSGIDNVIDSFNNISLSRVFDQVSSCFTGPTACGPPTIKIFGGGGSGASANAIISSFGQVIGADIRLPGSGYTSAPFVKISDSCGSGRGAYARSTINNKGQVTSIQVITPGYGYLPVPNGSYGGDGRVWAEQNETIVVRSDGTYDTPYPPDTEITLFPGDQVLFPDRTSYQDIESETTIVTPTSDSDLDQLNIVDSISSNGEYPVLLELTDVIVDSPGLNYSSVDIIKITPDNGSTLAPLYSPNGSILGVEVLSKGLGFSDIPEITIESASGFNAQLIPVLSVKASGDKVLEIQEEDPNIVDKVITVIDCVGKF